MWFLVCVLCVCVMFMLIDDSIFCRIVMIMKKKFVLSLFVVSELGLSELSSIVLVMFIVIWESCVIVSGVVRCVVLVV